MSPTPHALEQLIREFTKLPGIGPKTAERLVYYLLKQPKEELVSLADSLRQAKDEVVICRQCFRFADQDPCQNS